MGYYKMFGDFGVSGTALKWFDSFLYGHKQCVLISDKASDDLNCGVPRGSFIWPVLLSLFPTFSILSQHLPSTHGYADDTQLYFLFRLMSLESQVEAITVLESCIAEDCSCLMINDIKTEFLIIGSRHQLAKTTIDSIVNSESCIKPSESGSWFDAHMCMDVHIGKTRSKTFHGLYNIRQIRKFLNINSTNTLVLFVCILSP